MTRETGAQDMPILRAEHLSKTFAAQGRGSAVYAVNDVSLTLQHGDTLGLVGESGSGKSTLGRLLARLVEPDEGTVVLDGEDLTALRGRRLRRARSKFQVVFQEPYASLDPRMTILQIIEEPLVATKLVRSAKERRERVLAMLDEVGLPREFLTRKPGALSGGQQQRVGIARALISEPTFVVLDEPTSSLDQTVRASILQLLVHLQRTKSLTFVFISHDIHTVRRLCNRTAVMHLGSIVEIGPTENVMQRPQHPYTRSLLSAELSLTPGVPTRDLAPADPLPTDLPTGAAADAPGSVRPGGLESGAPELAVERNNR
ncbi:ATP-binding cassette domain-containing protein [Microbacterium sp. ASV81]|uniref:ATP-binding cassette domain-containing protein n=1 Tax=Microbacterium capsulatum TaxID=3041921 RepID=A0ABU0XHP2_9MICO|nr:ATP-binding cassette domain-containing protein [Microbacterium sp. ASV81]MDQ4214647.1 ATP-binding cassette domain-containing protein [Microbacterium sp. ASV81]